MSRKRAVGAAAIIAVLLGAGYVALRPSPAGEPSVRTERHAEMIAFSADG
jgi:hypothetical protein